MQTLVAEQPLLMAIMLGALAGAALFGWLQTGKQPALWIGLVLLALIPISWYISVAWVTDREQIREAIEATARAVSENDFDRAVQIIEPSQRQVISAARAELNRFRFSEARVNRFRSIEFVSGAHPPEAEVDLTASALVTDQRGQFTDYRVLRRVILGFRKAEDGNWYVYRYNHMSPIGEPDAYSPPRE